MHTPLAVTWSTSAISCKLINHGIKPSGQQLNSTLVVLPHNPLILVLLHPTSGYSEIHFYSKIHSEIAEIHVSGIINRYDHATLKNYISAVIYSSISSYTSLGRAKIKLSEKKYFGLRETIIFCTKKINKAYF